MTPLMYWLLGVCCVNIVVVSALNALAARHKALWQKLKRVMPLLERDEQEMLFRKIVNNRRLSYVLLALLALGIAALFAIAGYAAFGPIPLII